MLRFHKHLYYDKLVLSNIVKVNYFLYMISFIKFLLSMTIG